jgi:hypothetical protein
MTDWIRERDVAGQPVPGLPTEPTVETTGRLLVLVDTQLSRTGRPTAASLSRAEQALADVVGVSLAHSSEFVEADTGDAELLEAVEGTQGAFFDELGVCVIEAHEDWPERLAVATADAAVPIAQAEPERVVWAISDFADGYQAGVNGIVEALRTRPSGAAVVAPAWLPGGPFADDASFIYAHRSDDDRVGNWHLAGSGLTPAWS